MSDPEHARMMLDIARRDCKALRGMLDQAFFEDTVFGSHAQQAVEKSLKAWLSLSGVVYARIHDVEELFASLEAHGVTVPTEFRSLQNLTEYAVLLRYDVTYSSREPLNRAAVIAQVQSLLAHVEKLLEQAAGPQ